MANTETLHLDLDSKDFLDGVTEAGAKLTGLSQTSFDSLLGSFVKLKIAGEAIAVVMDGAKLALDLTMQAEQAKLVSVQYELLAKNAGLQGEAIKKSLLSIADGLEEEGNILQAASQGIVALGENGKRLPEIFELARKVTGAFGGELLANFKTLNEALATGQVRSLKQFGIVVDTTNALKEYAREQNVVVAALSDQEKRTALLNATLGVGNTALAGVTDESLKATLEFKRLSAAVGQLKEDFSLAFEKIAGPTVQNYLNGFKGMVQDASKYLVREFGEGAASTQAKLEQLTQKSNEVGAAIFDAQTKLEQFEKGGAASLGLLVGEYESTKQIIAQLEQEQMDIRAQRASYQALLDAQTAQNSVDQAASAAAQKTQIDQAAIDNRLAIETKFGMDLLNLQMQRVQSEIASATSVQELDRQTAELKTLIYAQLTAQESQWRAQVAAGQMTESQVDQMLAEQKIIAANQVRQVEMQHDQQRLAALQNFAALNANTASGFLAGWKVATTQAGNDMRNFSKLGQDSFGMLHGSLMAGFNAMASGSENAGEAMKKFFIGAIADKAAAAGATMLLEAIWPPNPVAAAGGAGLIALAATLKSSVGGGSSVKTPSTPAMGAATYTPPSMTTSAPTYSAIDYEMKPELEEKRETRAVNLIIQGNYFETAETRRVLTEMIRQEADATDFTITQIGVGG